jgi:hypothetical protein
MRCTLAALVLALAACATEGPVRPRAEEQGLADTVLEGDCHVALQALSRKGAPALRKALDAETAAQVAYREAKCKLDAGDDDGARAATALLDPASSLRLFLEARLAARAGDERGVKDALERWRAMGQSSSGAFLAERDFDRFARTPWYAAEALALYGDDAHHQRTPELRSFVETLAHKNGVDAVAVERGGGAAGDWAVLQGFVREMKIGDDGKVALKIDLLSARSLQTSEGTKYSGEQSKPVWGGTLYGPAEATVRHDYEEALLPTGRLVDVVLPTAVTGMALDDAIVVVGRLAAPAAGDARARVDARMVLPRRARAWQESTTFPVEL